MANNNKTGIGSLLTGGLISGGLGLLKGVIGGIQSIRGNKQMKNLLKNRPQYSIPEAYMKSLGLAQNLASQELPGQDYYTQQIGQSSARAMTGAERGAISSNVLQGSVESSQTKELQAIQDLAQMGVQWKTQQKQNLIAAQNQMGQLQDVQWQMNQLQPWDIKANMAQSKIQAGGQNLWGGITDIGNTVQNFVGTDYYRKILEEIQKNR